MYPRMEREFDRMIKKATPYLIFSPNNVRDTIADYMKSLWRAMRTNNTNDFDAHCTNINEMIAKSDGLTDGTLQIDISDFDGRWSSLDESISKLRKELIELKAEVKTIKKDSSPIIEGTEKRKRGGQEKIQVPIKEEVPTEVPIKEEVPTEVPTKKETYVKISTEKILNYLKNNKEITNSIVRNLCGVNIYQAKYLLQMLVKKEAIRKIGSRNRPKYMLVEGSDPIDGI